MGLRAKQVCTKPKRPLLAETIHRMFNIGEQIRLQSIDASGNYETGIVKERLEDYSGKVSHYCVMLDSNPEVTVRVSVWFVKGMDSPLRP